MTALARSIAELAGFACVAVAAFLLHPVMGFLVTGVVLILAANFGGRLVAPQGERRPTWPDDLT